MMYNASRQKVMSRP